MPALASQSLRPASPRIGSSAHRDRQQERTEFPALHRPAPQNENFQNPRRSPALTAASLAPLATLHHCASHAPTLPTAQWHSAPPQPSTNQQAGQYAPKQNQSEQPGQFQPSKTPVHRQ